MVARNKTPPAFHRLWTQRFWNTRRVTDDLVCEWYDEFMQSHGACDWRRFVITNWMGKPFASDQEVLQAVCWLAESGHPQVFASRRGRSHAHMGAQIWCMHPESEFLVQLMASPVKLVTSFTPEQFAGQLELMLGWLVPP